MSNTSQSWKTYKPVSEKFFEITSKNILSKNIVKAKEKRKDYLKYQEHTA